MQQLAENGPMKKPHSYSEKSKGYSSEVCDTIDNVLFMCFMFLLWSTFVVFSEWSIQQTYSIYTKLKERISTMYLLHFNRFLFTLDYVFFLNKNTRTKSISDMTCRKHAIEPHFFKTLLKTVQDIDDYTDKVLFISHSFESSF